MQRVQNANETQQAYVTTTSKREVCITMKTNTNFVSRSRSIKHKMLYENILH